MAKITDDRVAQVARPHLQPGETIESWAFGVKMPPFYVWVPLIAIALLPGLIAMLLLTKNYLLVLTDRRLLVLTIKSPSNATVKAVSEYALDELHKLDVKTSTGSIFTHIKIPDDHKPFVAKFHRAYSKENRRNAMAIAEAISA